MSLTGVVLNAGMANGPEDEEFDLFSSLFSCFRETAEEEASDFFWESIVCGMCGLCGSRKGKNKKAEDKKKEDKKKGRNFD